VRLLLTNIVDYASAGLSAYQHIYYSILPLNSIH